MTRRIRTILLFLLLGAIVNFAVAWSCVIWLKPFDADPSTAPSTEQVLRERFVIGDSRASFRGHFQHGRGWSHQFAHVLELPRDSNPARSSTVHIYRQGWPMYSLQGEHWFGDHIPRDGLHGGAVIRRRFFKAEEFLAMTPIPLGFACDSALYGGLLWLLLGGSFSLRRRIRRHRNRCTACGYDLRGAAHAVCPECGAAVRSLAA